MTTVALLPDTASPLSRETAAAAFADILDGRAEDEAIATFLIGLTERGCQERGLAYKVGKFPFKASGRALAGGDAEGFVKLVFGAEHGELLGAHIIGPEATELIAEMGLAITLEATREDLEATIHAHPTLSEAVHEAAAQAFGHAIHI